MNNHAASVWKDHFLDHLPRILELVKQKAVVKKPMYDAFFGTPVRVKRERGVADERGRDRDGRISVSTSSATLYEAPITPKREKLSNYKSKGSSGKGKGKGRIRVPRPEPTPPTNIVADRNGNKFTKEDTDYLIAYANYRLEEDPNLKKLDICVELARNVRRPSVCYMMHG